jgi:hypothetical protein
MSTDPEKLQLLGGALIVLSLALLFCWYSKQRSAFRSDRYGSFGTLEGLDAGQIGLMTAQEKRAYLPGLNFKQAGSDNSRASLHDMVNPGVQFHLPANMKGKVDQTAMRWSADAFVGSADNAMAATNRYNDANYLMNNSDIAALNKGGVVIPSEVITPARPEDALDCGSLSTSAMQLQNSDYMPQYGSLAGSGGISL